MACKRARRVFCESTTSSSFATLVCGKASPSGAVEIYNAGHCPPLLVSAQGTRSLEAAGLPLGLFCSSPYGVEKIQLEPGEFLLLYTDGLTEAQNKFSEEYGTSRLAKVVSEGCQAPARGIVGACLRDLESFLSGASRTDDLAIMAVRRL